VPTEAERRAAVCERDDLASLAPTVALSPNVAADSGPVLDVAVLDAAGHREDVRAEATAPIAIGAPFDEAAARETSRRLWKTGRFADVAVESSADRGGVRVVFRVTPKPSIAHVFVAGETSSDDVATALRLEPGAPYDPVAIVSARRELRAALESKGLLDADATVSSAFVTPDRSSVDLCVRVKRGAVVTIDAIGAHGSAYDRDLDAVLASEDTKNVPGSVVDRDVLDRDEVVLAGALSDRGLVTHKIERKLVRHGDAITISFDVTDGPVFHYGKVDVRGQLVAPKAEYTKLVTFKRGAVFNRSEVAKAIDAIRALDTSRGRPDLDVEPEPNVDAATGTVALVIEVKGSPGFSTVDLKRGAGRAAASGDTATLHYTGKLLDGTVFDSSIGRAPFTFKLGGGSVIQGFERGVMGMKVGGKRRVTIPPDLGYGKRGAPPKIPPSSTLVFEIELLSIQ
jgi:outer membrane protein assembly factor BamA